MAVSKAANTHHTAGVLCSKQRTWLWSLACPQGASPQEVQQRLYASAVRGAIGDDVQGFATLFPAARRDLLDISSTPNRLVTSNLTAHVRSHTVL
jgi:hypothetical protein